MLILGLNAYHGDSSACLVEDGQLFAAAEEERFTRIKHWAGFPAQSIAWCLKERGAKLSDVSAIAINRDPQANKGRKLAYVLKSRPGLKMILDRLANRKRWAGIEADLDQAFPGHGFTGRIDQIEHHLCHLASAFLVSPFEEAVTVSIDGFGDFSSTAWGFGKGSKIDVAGRVYFPHSLGVFYQALTQYLGFPHYGDEYKVMGLAPYGKPVYADKLQQLVNLHSDGGFSLNLAYFRHAKEDIGYEWQGGEPRVGNLFGKALEDLLGPARKKEDALEQMHMDMARSVQAVYEKAFFHIIETTRQRYGGAKSLTLAGGCAYNSVANGKVTRNTGFENIYVQSASGDAGGAIGAALLSYLQQGGDLKAPAGHPAGATRGGRKSSMTHAYWGPSSSEADIKAVLDANQATLSSDEFEIRHFDDPQALCEAVTDRIVEGAVVGWFQGRLEWGPRALGNRSILADPRRTDMKEILNAKIKRRESFRPFAPSVLREAVPDWFELDDDVPFMMKVFPIRAEKREQIPAVTHVDGTGRLQTVSADTNPLYHRLISTYCARTGVPMLLNTSFNENEPVVCLPEEAMACFLRTRMDLLVLGNCTIYRKAG